MLFQLLEREENMCNFIVLMSEYLYYPRGKIVKHFHGCFKNDSF